MRPAKTQIRLGSLIRVFVDATVPIGPSVCTMECERSGNEMLV